MDGNFHLAPSEQQQQPQPRVFHGNFGEELYAPPWPPSEGRNSLHGFRTDFAPSTGPQSFGGSNPPYGFDPSVPPPAFGFPIPGPFPPVPTVPVNTYRPSFQTQQAVREPAPFEPRTEALETPAENDAAVQREQDEQWVRHFLQSRGKPCEGAKRPQQRRTTVSVCEFRELLYGAAQQLSQLSETCQLLKHNLDNDGVWTQSFLKALSVKRELQDKLSVLDDTETLKQLKAKLSYGAKKKARRARAKMLRQTEANHRELRSAEKEAMIDKWRMRQIQEVEEKKKERELKLAADSVLCEVRKKQADVKRMQDILRSLEKLRKLRKEAASRKGISVDQESDQAFSSRLEELRCLMRRRTAVYSAEEKALMVMLEGEQEEERRRDLEKQQKKERERYLHRKQKVDAMLFGDEMPADPLMQPFKEYYTQADCSVHALVHIRREWDFFLVPADHPDGTEVPDSWVLPDAPSDQVWASALQASETL
ncbi:programmed cell death protein 7 [Thalassophryne amazonica]|uniref:programmed cell death protein 7 n=1 Tax=Thalassophryne amazonica TaxID=390379 RepID=UPI00147196A4|nr:programmed cell death protein 7 [Thalassophryne amazonica]XP_034040300.1 programmed cell death protein 7 [Thalassophryne amazonica]